MHDLGPHAVLVHVIEIHIIWPKYRHAHTHTQTRTTYTNPYTSMYFNHKHLNKHKKQVQTHQQAQSQPHGRTQCGQQPRKNTHKHQHRHNHVCVVRRVHMHTDGLQGCSGVLWSGAKRKVGGTGHRRRQGGHCWTHMVKAGCQYEKATTPTGPKRKQKQYH